MRPSLIQIADALRKSRLGQVFGPGRKDVYAWRWSDRIARFAFVMDLKRMPESGIVRGGSEWFPWEVQNTFGVEPDWNGFRSHLSEAVTVLEKAIAKVMGEKAVLSIMPLEGQPWGGDDDETEFYSSRKRRVMTASQPWGYLVWEDEIEHVDYPGVDLRQYLPRVDDISAPLLWQHGEVVLSCTVGIDPSTDTTDLGLASDLVMPSLRVGSFPEDDPGKIVFAFSMDLVDRGLQPSPRPSTWPVVLYDRPVWSEAEEDPMVGSTRLYAQLTGSWKPGDYESDVFAWGYAGPPKPKAVRAKQARVIRTVRRALRRSRQIWQDADAPMRHEDDTGQSPEPPTMQAKVFGLLDLNSAPVAVCHDRLSQYAEDFLDAIDWPGELLVVSDLSDTMPVLEQWAARAGMVDRV